MLESKKQQMQSPHWWWFDSHNTPNQKRSPWLQSALAELDEKTKAMLKLIEEDADSFAQRAEMYYRKRPELISMVEDFYRTHRSLAERYDQFKLILEPLAYRQLGNHPYFGSKFRPERLMSLSSMEKAYDSYSETYELEESEHSDVEDPDPEEAVEYDEEMERKDLLIASGNSEVEKLREEIALKEEENRAQKELLMQKDEKKREVIRQLSLAMDLLREENVELRKRLVKEPPKRQNGLEFNKLKEVFWRRLFNVDL